MTTSRSIPGSPGTLPSWTILDFSPRGDYAGLTGKKRGDSRIDKTMDFDDFFGPKPIVIDLRAENRWEAIDELIDHLVANQKIKSEQRDAVLETVRKRESLMSTGIGFGIGLLHASTNLICDVVLAVGRSRKGVPFETLDRKPVDLVILFLVPEGQFQKHLHTLANFAKLVPRADFRDWLWRRFE